MAENKNTTETKMERANRIAVQNTPTGYKADFYRTHKHLATLLSENTTWQADESANKSAQREDFRKFAIEHADMVGILWNPADLRSAENVRIPKYENDEMLKSDAIKLLWDNLWDMTKDCGLDVEFGILSADYIVPMTHSAKGTDLSKLGITDGKYNSTGNWAWAEVEMTLTLTKAGQEIYYTTTAQLVSGQLKKPHITKTSFIESVRESLKEAGLWEEEAKESAKDSKAEEAKAKKSRSKKTTAQATAN